MKTYSVEKDDRGGYSVRVTRTGGDRDRFIEGFPTESKAQAWIDNQAQIAMTTVIASDLA